VVLNYWHPTRIEAPRDLVAGPTQHKYGVHHGQRTIQPTDEVVVQLSVFIQGSAFIQAANA
jgi:hypothetical protein